MLHIVAEVFFVAVAFGALALVAFMLQSERETILAALTAPKPLPAPRRIWTQRVRAVSPRPAMPLRAQRSLRVAA